MPGYLFRPISDEEAREISGWSYEPPYDFYDWMSDPDDLEESLDPKRRKGASFSILDDEEALVGFFRIEAKYRTVDVGLGLDYSLAGLEFARQRHSPTRFTLTVATFSERASRVYQRAGFRRERIYTHHTTAAICPSWLWRGKREARRGYAPTTQPSANRATTATRTRPLSAVPRAEKSLLRVRCIRPATPSPSPTTYRIRHPKTPMPISASPANAGESCTVSGSRVCGSTFSNAEAATNPPTTKRATSTTVARIAMTNDATPILECAFSLAGPLPAPVSYVNLPPYGETELSTAERVSEPMVAYGGGR